MKNKTLLFILLTLVLTLTAIIPAMAQAVPEEVATEAGASISVKFQYEEVAGINGVITFSNPEMLASVEVTQEGFGEVENFYNPKNGMLVLSNISEVNAAIIINVTVADNAKSGDTCIATFEYEISKENAVMPEVPVYSKEEIKIYVLDYTELRNQIAEAGTYNKDEYTEASWANLEAALESANAALKATTQTEIDNAATALENAILALEKKPVIIPLDYSALQEQIDKANALVESEYTAESWAAMKTELDKANALMNNANSQDEIQSQTDALREAIENLKVKLNYDELDNQIGKAEDLLADEDEYTTESWAAMIAALGSARSARTNATTQEEVDAAANGLKDAILALEKKPVIIPLDYSALQEQIDKANALVESEYTAESWANMKAELDKANALMNNANTQDEIQAQADALKEAIAALQKVSVSSLDFSVLDKLIADAESKDKDKYTEETWNNMMEALERARETRKNATTQEEINNSVDSLSKSIDALELKDNKTGDSSIMLILSIVVLVVGTALMVYSKKKETVR